MAPRGRRFKEIDQGKLEGMMMYGATCLECANEFDCSEDTIVRFVKRVFGMNYADLSYKKQGTIRMKLRMKQIQMALNGSVPMAIFLGKQYLGQADKIESDVDLAPTAITLSYNVNK